MSTQKKNGAPARSATLQTTHLDNPHSSGFPLPRQPVHRTGSHQVASSEVLEFVQQILAEVPDWPEAGTPEWVALDDNDERKLAAVIAGGLHWALRIDCLQTESAEASRAVSESADWSEISQQARRRQDAITSGAYIPRQRSA